MKYDGSKFILSALRYMGLICLIIHVESAIGHSPPPVLNPKTYLSPSNQYSLTVEPSDKYGCYGASYSMNNMGNPTWKKEFPFTLWDASVTDEGVILGYAYSLGPQGWRENGGKSDNLHIVIIGSNGVIRMDKRYPRKQSPYLGDDFSYPLVEGLLVNSEYDRFILRITDRDIDSSHESWWVFNLSKGKYARKFDPATTMDDSGITKFILTAKPIPRNDLYLIHWWRYQGGDLGAYFTLIDSEGKVVWKLERNTDYNIPGDESAQDRQMDIIRSRGAILNVSPDGKFELFFVSESKAVTFVIKEDAHGKYTVSEIARRDMTLDQFNARKESKDEVIPEKPLKFLGKIELKPANPQPDSPIRNISRFAFDDRGNIAFERFDNPKNQSFVYIDSNGKILKEIEIPSEIIQDPTYWSNHCLAWIGGQRFVHTRSSIDIKGKAKAWWVDFKTESIDEIQSFDCPAIDELVGTSEGGFVALTTLKEKYTSQDALYAFTPQGKRDWSIAEDYERRNLGYLFSPEDVTVSSDGTIAVLDVIQKTIQLYQSNGHYIKAIDLEKQLGRKPSYPTDIEPDQEGGFIVYDFQGTPPVIRMRADGTVWSQFTPKYADGRNVTIIPNVTISPDKRMWTSDGQSLLRLTDEGIVDLVLGKPPVIDTLGKVAALQFDSNGRIYAADSRTGSVHVFDSEGEFLYVCRPNPTDFNRDQLSSFLAISNKGEAYLGSTISETHRYLHFSSTGKRLGFESVSLDTVSQEWYFQPQSENLWIVGYESLYLVDSNKKILRTIKKQPDGKWLGSMNRASVANDGSIAVVSHPGVFEYGNSVVNIYSKEGEPLLTLKMPSQLGSFCPIAYNGQYLAAAQETNVVLLNTQDSSLTQFIPSDNKEKVLHPYFHPQRKELLLWVPETTTIYRYELP